MRPSGERDKLAEELVRVYPLIAEQLAELAARARVQLADAGVRPRPPVPQPQQRLKKLAVAKEDDRTRNPCLKRGAWASEAEIE